jgi:hypothetical protein
MADRIHFEHDIPDEQVENMTSEEIYEVNMSFENDLQERIDDGEFDEN